MGHTNPIDLWLSATHTRQVSSPWQHSLTEPPAEGVITAAAAINVAKDNKEAGREWGRAEDL